MKGVLLCRCLSSLALVVTVLCGPPVEGYEIRVRGRAELTVDVTTAGTSLQVYGRLRDDARLGLPQRKVTIRIQPDGNEPTEETTVHTDFRGGFEWQGEMAPGNYRVEVVLPETDHVTGARLYRPVTVTMAPARLDMRVPGVVAEGAREAWVQLAASASGTGLMTTVEFRVNEGPLQVVELDRFGRARVNVASEVIAGENVVEAVLAATEHREEVRVRERLRGLRGLEIDATTRPVYERLERGLEMRAAVSDGQGPVANLQVAMSLKRTDAGDERVLEASARTDDRGRVRHVFSGQDIEDGTWVGQIIVSPDAGESVAAMTQPVVLARESSRRLLNGLGLLGIVAVFLLVASPFAARIAEHWARRRAHRKARETRARAYAAVETLAVTELEAGDEPQASQVHDGLGLSGLVWDVWRRRPVANATLSLRQMDSDGAVLATVRSDEGGRFRLQGKAPGHYDLLINAPGFVDGQLALSLPHAGNLGRIRLDMVAVPLKIRRVFQAMVESLEGEDLWGKLTPRQIEEALLESLQGDVRGACEAHRQWLGQRLEAFRSMSPQDDGRALLDLLVHLVEESYYGNEEATTDHWHVARDIAMRLTEMARQGKAEGAR
jgi:hypothetical protein